MWKVLGGVFLGWSLGANDSANIFGTGVATGVIKYRTAIWLSAAFIMVGAAFEGSKCMQTLNELSRLVPLEAFYCTLAAAVTMTLLTYFAMPASTSQAIIGAVMGAGLISGAADFSRLYKIVACWVFTPIGGIIFGYSLLRILGYLLGRLPAGLAFRNMLYTVGIFISGCYAAYSLGGNNVANVTGVYVGAGLLSAQKAVWLGGVSIAIGVLTYSRKVMMTVGKGIAPLDPFSAFVVVLAEALTLHLFTQIGVPVSSSQAVVGAVVGVGLVADMRTVSTAMLGKIALSWVVTPLSAGILAYLLIRWTV